MTKNTKIILWIIIAIIVIGGIWYGISQNPGVSQKPAEKETIKIGAMGPLTGVRASGGEYMRRGLEIALEEINSEGINGRKVKLVYEDTQYKPDIAVSAFNRLVDIEGIKFVVGFQGSSPLLAVAPIAEEKKILVITHAPQGNKISEAGDYIFRTQITSRQEIPRLIDFMKKQNISKIAILYLLTDYGVEYNEIFTKEFEKTGGKVVAAEGFEPGDNDFRTQLTKIYNTKPEAILVAGASKNVGMIKKQSYELGIDIRFFATSPVEEKDVLDIAGDLANGIIYPYPYDVESTDEFQKSFREKYKEKYNEPTNMLVANAYDALKLLADGLKECGENPECVKNYLYSVKDYHGAGGILSFDQNGDVEKPIIIKTIKNGQFVPYTD